jgi:hypothetical protein
MQTITKDTIQNIVKNINRDFRTFGGDYVTRGNPISIALAGKDVQFAAGVDVKEVVEYVIYHLGIKIK